MRSANLLIASFVVCTAATAPVAGQSPVSFSETWYTEGNPVTAEFRAWMPAGLDRIRGVVFSIPGSGGDTRNITTNGSWRGKLTGMGFAVIGVRDTQVSSGNFSYWGSGAQEISANMSIMISDMAEALGHPEINNAPLLLEGVSHGAFATSDIVQAIPERILGYVQDKGADYLWADPAKYNAISKVPGLLILGASDDTVIPPTINQSFNDFRSVQARVVQEVDWVGHQNTHPDKRFAYIDQIYRFRFPHGQLPSLEPGNPLAPVDLPLSSGWVGEVNPVNFFLPYVEQIEWPEITPNDQYQYVNNYAERSWLPSEAMALVYRAQNSTPAGVSRDALGIVAANARDRNVNGGAPIDLELRLTEIPYTSIDVYHESELIAQFSYSGSPQHVFYTPTETGIHTFVAVASYQFNGQVHYTSAYTTVGVAFISSSIAGDYNGDHVVDAADFTVWRDLLGQSGLGLAADGTGPLGPPDGIVDQLDYDLWKTHFGEVVGAAAVATVRDIVAVPEPGTGVLLLGFAGLIRFAQPRRART
jgi:predicted esterase